MLRLVRRGAAGRALVAGLFGATGSAFKDDSGGIWVPGPVAPRPTSWRACFECECLSPKQRCTAAPPRPCCCCWCRLPPAACLPACLPACLLSPRTAASHRSRAADRELSARWADGRRASSTSAADGRAGAGWLAGLAGWRACAAVIRQAGSVVLGQGHSTGSATAGTRSPGLLRERGPAALRTLPPPPATRLGTRRASGQAPAAVLCVLCCACSAVLATEPDTGREAHAAGSRRHCTHIHTPTYTHTAPGRRQATPPPLSTDTPDALSQHPSMPSPSPVYPAAAQRNEHTSDGQSTDSESHAPSGCRLDGQQD